MRILFFLLLLANVAWFAWEKHGAELISTEADLVAQQLRPEAIRLLSSDQVVRAAGANREEAKVRTCIEWGAFAGPDVASAEQALAPVVPAANLSRRRTEETDSWWVYMPPQGSRQAATVKTAELKRLGVEEFFILQDDPKFRFAISLGVFRTEEAARNFLEQLRAKGVRTAQAAAREVPAPKTWFQVRDAGPAVAEKLNSLKQAFPGSEIRECGAAEAKS